MSVFATVSGSAFGNTNVNAPLTPLVSVTIIVAPVSFIANIVIEVSPAAVESTIPKNARSGSNVN